MNVHVSLGAILCGDLRDERVEVTLFLDAELLLSGSRELSKSGEVPDFDPQKSPTMFE